MRGEPQGSQATPAQRGGWERAARNVDRCLISRDGREHPLEVERGDEGPEVERRRGDRNGRSLDLRHAAGIEMEELELRDQLRLPRRWARSSASTRVPEPLASFKKWFERG